MIRIKIDPIITNLCPNIALGAISCNVETEPINTQLWELIKSEADRLKKDLTVEKIRNLSTIETSKQAYRKLGKDPNRYRLSAEALLRRIVNGKDISQINNIVDVLNLVSIRTGFSIGGYNSERIKGEVCFGIGKPLEYYQGIGKGILNIENLPILRDNIGAFGSPTSDSLRTQIDPLCKHFLMIIISFQKEKMLSRSMDYAINLLCTYANADQFDTQIIIPKT